MASPLSVSVPLLPGSVATGSVPLKVDAALAPQVGGLFWHCDTILCCSCAVPLQLYCCSTGVPLLFLCLSLRPVLFATAGEGNGGREKAAGESQNFKQNI